MVCGSVGGVLYVCVGALVWGCGGLLCFWLIGLSPCCWCVGLLVCLIGLFWLLWVVCFAGLMAWWCAGLVAHCFLACCAACFDGLLVRWFICRLACWRVGSVVGWAVVFLGLLF